MNLTMRVRDTNTMTAISMMHAITTTTEIVAIIATSKLTACGLLDGGGVREEGADDDGSVSD